MKISCLKRIGVGLIFLFTISSSSLLAQSFEAEIDSLKNLITLQINSSEKARLLNEISFAYRRVNVDSVMYFGNLALELSKKIKDRRNEAYAYKHIGIAGFKQGTDYKQTIKHYEQALNIAKELKEFKLQASCANNIGLVYHTLFQLEKSLEYYFQGLGLYENQIKENDFVRGLLLGNTASSYRELDKQDKALQYFKAVIDYANANGITRLNSIYCDDYAKSLHHNGQSQKALVMSETCIIQSEAIKDHHSNLQALINLAEIKYDLGDYKKSIEVAKICEQKARDKKFKIILSKCLLVLAKAQKAVGNFDETLKLGIEAYDNSIVLENYWQSASVSKLLSEIYAERGNYAEAYKYHQAFYKFNKSNYDQKSAYISSELEAKYQNENQQKTIAFLNKENILKQQTNTLYQVGLVLLTLMLMATFFLFSNKQKAMKKMAVLNKRLEETQKQLNLKNAELEKYIESNIQLEQFAHVASHDLRAPIITINSFSQLLLETTKEKLDANEQQYLGFVKSNAAQMLDLVNDLLEYARINSQKINHSNLNVQALVQNVTTTLNNKTQEATIKIVQPLPTITADEIKLKRVFQNLISNALKFTNKQKQALIEIYAKEREQNWEFHVKDNGIGIQNSHQATIFKPYVRLHSKSQYTGTGLGLSVCQKIIEQHGGYIKCHSTYGKGSDFYFTIPKNILPS